jgi:hypothetical protein
MEKTGGTQVDNLLFESGIKMPKGTRAAKVIYH